MSERILRVMRASRLLGIALAVGWAVVLPSSAEGCSCMEPPQVCYAYGEAAAVFVGRVTSITPPAPMHPQPSQPNSGDLNPARANRVRANGSEIRIDYSSMNNRIRFAVEQVFAGEDESEIEVQTHSQGSACGRDFTRGERYLVYAERLKQGGPLMTTICDRTRLVSQAEKDLVFLRSLPPKGNDGKLDVSLSVINSDSQPFLPLAGVRILAASETHSAEAITSAAGRVHFEALPAGRYRITADFPEPLEEAYPSREIQVNDGGCSSYALLAKRKER